jgi:hypothetical protein
LLTALAQARDDETFARLLRDGGRALLHEPAAIGLIALEALGKSGELGAASPLLAALEAETQRFLAALAALPGADSAARSFPRARAAALPRP